MPVQVSRGMLQSEVIMDDISNNENKETELPAVDEDKLAKLKARLAAKEKETAMTSAPVKRERSINFGIVGSGQAGDRIAEAFYKLGYDAVAINTAPQDLKFITIPESNKLLLDYSLGGAAKEIEIGFKAAESHRALITELVNTQLADAQILILASSLGGGSGAGSCEVLVDILSATGKPLAVITVLPMDSEDVQTKDNALKTLSKLTRFTQSKKIHNLIVVDNAKIESIYSNVSQIDFFGLANKAIVEPIDVFNTLSSKPSAVKGLDSMEWAKLFTDGEGISIYGELIVSNYVEETSIAEAVISNLNGNLLAGGFDLKETKYAGFILSANKNVWDKVPAASVNYATAMVNDLCGNPQAVFKGVYVNNDSSEDVIKIYSFFSGLGLPSGRVDQLRKEVADLQSKTKEKGTARNLSLNLNTGADEAISAAQKIKDKIASKSSSFGKLVSSNVIDRRK